jgi:hypothetical protein
VTGIADSLARDGTSPEEVWQVYARLEKTIAVLKFKLDYETPGLSTKLPPANDRGRLLEDARVQIIRSASELGSGDFESAIETLRRARNDLRSLLTPSRVSKRRTAS